MDLIIDSGKNIVLSHLLEYNSKRASRLLQASMVWVSVVSSITT
jgi:hypothetical protein